MSLQRKQAQIDQFNPNGVGVENGNFIGLPFDEETADIHIVPVPWDVTVSYGAGTSNSYQNVLDASYQLDLYLEHQPDFWKRGIYFQAGNEAIVQQNQALRAVSEPYIEFLEQGHDIATHAGFQKDVQTINTACTNLHETVQATTAQLLQQGKKVALLGGEHSVPLGYIKALAEQHEDFGILQFDAHCDLRKAYEGFKYSHASIFYNVLQEVPQVSQLTQIGIRDFCHEEATLAQTDERVRLFSDNYIKNEGFKGRSFANLTQEILDTLPQKVYISFDIDALNPSLCPETGTPVPGGFSFNEALFILHQLQQSDKEVIGVDLCEVGGTNEWDGNVGARILYHLMSCLT